MIPIATLLGPQVAWPFEFPIIVKYYTKHETSPVWRTRPDLILIDTDSIDVLTG